MTTNRLRQFIAAVVIVLPSLAFAQVANIPGVYLSGSPPTGFGNQAFKMDCNNATPTSGQCWPLIELYDAAGHQGTINADSGLNVHVVNTNANGAATSSGSSPVTIATDQFTASGTPATAGPSVQGMTASGASFSEAPIGNGLLATSTQPTAVTNGQKVKQMGDLQGRGVIIPYAPAGLVNNGNGSSTTTTAITVQAASGSASFKEYMTKLHCGRSDAGTTAITLAISDATTTVTEVLPNNGGGGVANFSFDPPLAWVVNHAVTVVPSAGVTTLYCDAQGFNAS